MVEFGEGERLDVPVGNVLKLWLRRKGGSGRILFGVYYIFFSDPKLMR